MGIYIHGVSMPKDGLARNISIFEDGSVRYYGGSRVIGSAIELPPHGRLGDLDELHKEAVGRSEKAGVCNNWYNCTNRVISAFDIENAPTILPAEGGADNA